MATLLEKRRRKRKSQFSDLVSFLRFGVFLCSRKIPIGSKSQNYMVQRNSICESSLLVKLHYLTDSVRRHRIVSVRKGSTVPHYRHVFGSRRVIEPKEFMYTESQES